MHTIHKYTLNALGANIVHMPWTADLLSVAVQEDGALRLWALVDTSAKTVAREIHVFGTGHEITPPLRGSLKYVGTVHTPAGYVWHVFDNGERPL